MEDRNENTLKLRISYEEGSQTLSQCKLDAKDSDLLAVAQAIIGLRKDPEASVAKIASSDLA